MIYCLLDLLSQTELGLMLSKKLMQQRTNGPLLTLAVMQWVKRGGFKDGFLSYIPRGDQCTVLSLRENHWIFIHVPDKVLTLVFVLINDLKLEYKGCKWFCMPRCMCAKSPSC